MQLSLVFDSPQHSIVDPGPELNPARAILPRKIRPGLHCDARISEVARDLSYNVKSFGLGSRVTVWWNPRLQTTAGTADFSRSRIDLNPKLVPLGEGVIDQILRHELAHLVAVDRNPGRRISPHGHEWKEACIDLSIPGERASHSLPLEPSGVVPRYAYRCPNCKQIIRRKRKMSPHRACYDCCKEFNGGDYHANFAFQRVASEIGLAG